jgi:dihydroorotase-like cyclic amidohydrolase
VHIAQPSGPGIVMADDFESGARSAAFGGNTLIMPFCLQQKGESLRQAVKDYHTKAQAKCYIDVSFHLIISDLSPNVLGQELRHWSEALDPVPVALFPAPQRGAMAISMGDVRRCLLLLAS